MPDTRPASLVDQVEVHLSQTHAAMRKLVDGLSVETLDWRPGPETNSVAALCMHLLDAERHLTAWVAGVDLPRDREARFRVEGLTPAQIASEIDAVEGDVRAHLGRIGEEQLARSITRGERTRPGAWWLLQVVGHSREHLGQAELTLQLAQQEGSAQR